MTQINAKVIYPLFMKRASLNKRRIDYLSNSLGNLAAKLSTKSGDIYNLQNHFSANARLVPVQGRRMTLPFV